MKKSTLMGMMAVLLGVGVARGALYTETFGGVNLAIPDGNPVGVSLGETVSDIPGGSTVSGLTVDLSVSGGYNGNLYAYLVAPNGTLVMLLNQPGALSNPFGYAGSGLNVTLSDTAAGSIQTTPETPGSVFSGTFQAAGTLGAVSGSAADGTWTLYFADVAAGGQAAHPALAARRRSAGATDQTQACAAWYFDWVADGGDASEPRLDVGLHCGCDGARRRLEDADDLG